MARPVKKKTTPKATAKKKPTSRKPTARKSSARKKSSWKVKLSLLITVVGVLLYGASQLDRQSSLGQAYQQYIGQYVENYHYKFTHLFSADHPQPEGVLPHQVYGQPPRTLTYDVANVEPIDSTRPYNSLPMVSNYCHEFMIYGNPSFDATTPLAQVNLYLCRLGYVVGYNYQTKQPTWVIYRITSHSVNPRLERNDVFAEDSDVPRAFRAQLSDYQRSGYDRGHLAPYASLDFNQLSADQSFLLSNMSPQQAGLNRQGWERLENYERRWANMYQALFIYTGPIYKKQRIHQTIGYNKVAVPDYYFKILYAPLQNKAIAFVVPNAQVNRDDVAKYRVSIDSIEQRTGLKFFTALPEEQRQSLISKVSPMWRTSYW